LVGIAILVTPSSLAIATAITSPRALNDPVGNRPSSLTHTLGPPDLAIGTKGVSISPRLTTFSVWRTGSNSRQRHRSVGRASIIARGTNPRTAPRS
jgi:hypothetical protein